jgi:hypothetical protein
MRADAARAPTRASDMLSWARITVHDHVDQGDERTGRPLVSFGTCTPPSLVCPTPTRRTRSTFWRSMSLSGTVGFSIFALLATVYLFLAFGPSRPTAPTPSKANLKGRLVEGLQLRGIKHSPLRHHDAAHVHADAKSLTIRPQAASDAPAECGRYGVRLPGPRGPFHSTHRSGQLCGILAHQL